MLKSTGGCGYTGADAQTPDQGPQHETLPPHVQAGHVELWTFPFPCPLPTVLISIRPPIDLPRISLPILSTILLHLSATFLCSSHFSRLLIGHNILEKV